MESVSYLGSIFGDLRYERMVEQLLRKWTFFKVFYHTSETQGDNHHAQSFNG